MPTLGLETDIVDSEIYQRCVRHLRDARVLLPTFSELADPQRIPDEIREKLASVDPDAPHPLNLFRIHWYNDRSTGGLRNAPEMWVAPPSLTGVRATIILMLADTFPMIHAHKVLATYGCLVPRVVCGQLDPTYHRAVWPSTGNYCRGGVAVSRILGCRGVAVLPEGMSRERFEWLERWVEEPEDIVRTPGSESNVKEIYDRCRELGRDPQNLVFNQFREMGNYLAHYHLTGPALERGFEALQGQPGDTDLRLRAFVSATGSAGTLAAGDYLKQRYGSRTVAVEALECPTMLANGFGEHNIQGIGDKHIPLIHNVMATDFVAGVSDEATDELCLLFNSAEGRRFLGERCDLSPEQLEPLSRLGFSAICNLLAAIQLARHLDLGEEDVVASVATDGAELYASELPKIAAERFPRRGLDTLAAAETFGRHLRGLATAELQELTHRDRERIFNLGYYTWVEQQRVTLEDFMARKDPAFWRSLLEMVPAWDEDIAAFNRATGVRERL